MSPQTAAQPLSPGEDLRIERTFDAPVPLVFRLWEEREHMMRWFSPSGFTCTHLEMDFRPGGTWRACVRSETRGQSWSGGAYREIERNRRIVFTFAWDDEQGRPGVETLVTVTFVEQDGKTVQSFRQVPYLHDDRRDARRGWNQAFDKLQAYAETLAKSGAP